jgi:Predicted oxidoreductases of the aldo/keto reductase family
MKTTTLSNGKTVSVVGIGGHYRHFEYGRFEETYGPVEEKEIYSRAAIVKIAVENGITYFDTTWYNEVEMLAKTLELTGLRDKVHVNGMVLGAFRGATGFGISDRDYFKRYLDKRLAIIPGNRFDSFMINAAEEDYNKSRCEGLIKLLLERKAAGELGMIGFSCHDHRLARVIADDFPEMEIIMTAYNFHNRSFEKYFNDYSGNASFVAMKPLVWAQYGLAFCAINNIPNFTNNLNFTKDPEAAVKALRFPRTMPKLNVTVCAVNNENELDLLIKSGDGSFNSSDADVLYNYEKAIGRDDGIPLFLGGLMADSIRSNFFAADNLCRILGIDKSDLTVKNPDASEVISKFRKIICEKLSHSKYSCYL